MNISAAILGLTVLAWGNSIGDLAADVSIAKVCLYWVARRMFFNFHLPTFLEWKGKHGRCGDFCRADVQYPDWSRYFVDFGHSSKLSRTVRLLPLLPSVFNTQTFSIFHPIVVTISTRSGMSLSPSYSSSERF